MATVVGLHVTATEVTVDDGEVEVLLEPPPQLVKNKPA
jgi:hypothetical protein